MKRRICSTALIAASMLLGTSAIAAEEADRAPSKGEVKLAKMIEGRTAGEPRRCLVMSSAASLQVLDGTALVYKRGKTVWVNVPDNPDSLDDDDILVTYPLNANSLCHLDRVETRDRYNGFFTGTVFLGDFVPYTKEG